jgi:hypothetical protein
MERINIPFSGAFPDKFIIIPVYFRIFFRVVFILDEEADYGYTASVPIPAHRAAMITIPPGRGGANCNGPTTGVSARLCKNFQKQPLTALCGTCYFMGGLYCFL